MVGITDPKIILESFLQELDYNITVWMNAYTDKKNKDKDACFYLAPASYKEQMAYINKTCSQPDVANILSDQLKKDLSLLSQRFDERHQKDKFEKINELNASYATYLKGLK